MPEKKRRHILHVTHNMDIGGTEQVIKQIISGLDPREFISSIVCVDGRVGEIGQQLIASEVNVVAVERGSGLDTGAIKGLRKLIKASGADVVHCHQYTPFCYGALASFGLNIQVIFTEHGRFHPDSFTWKRRLVNQLLYRLVNRITCISSATRQALSTYEWIPKRCVEVIYNGVQEPVTILDSSAIRSNLGISPDSVVLGTISRFDPIKNQVMMIEALASLRIDFPDVALILAGDGPERARLEERASALGVSDIVYFPGFISNIGDYLTAIDIFLLTSFSEGTSMTLLEAMASRKVVVATAVGGNVEVIEHGRTGLLVDSGDHEALKESLTALCVDKSACERLSEAARNEYCIRFSLHTMAAAYRGLYCQVDSDRSC